MCGNISKLNPNCAQTFRLYLKVLDRILKAKITYTAVKIKCIKPSTEKEASSIWN